MGGVDGHGRLGINGGGDCTWQRHQAGAHRQPRKRFGHEHSSPPDMEPALRPVFRYHHFSKKVGSVPVASTGVFVSTSTSPRFHYLKKANAQGSPPARPPIPSAVRVVPFP